MTRADTQKAGRLEEMSDALFEKFKSAIAEYEHEPEDGEGRRTKIRGVNRRR